jgi:hypothetical protein
MKIQSTKILTDAMLQTGYEADFDTSQDLLLGIMFILVSGGNFGASTVEFKIDVDTVLPRETPAQLLNSNAYTPPNERFFTLFEERRISGKKYKITKTSTNVVPDTIVVFLLDKKNDNSNIKK